MAKHETNLARAGRPQALGFEAFLVSGDRAANSGTTVAEQGQQCKAVRHQGVTLAARVEALLVRRQGNNGGKAMQAMAMATRAPMQGQGSPRLWWKGRQQCNT
jgi:hypothetical protein